MVITLTLSVTAGNRNYGTTVPTEQPVCPLKDARNKGLPEMDICLNCTRSDCIHDSEVTFVKRVRKYKRGK